MNNLTQQSLMRSFNVSSSMDKPNHTTHSVSSKWRPIQQKRQRNDDYQQTTILSNNSNRIITPSFAQANTNTQSHTISMISNHGYNIENALRGYARPQSLDDKFNRDVNMRQNQQPNQLNSSFNSNSDTLPIITNTAPYNQALNQTNYNYRVGDEQEIMRRDRIKEQNLQEKTLIVQKEQKIQSEIALSFKQMSRLLDACLKFDETGSGITSIKQNDLYLSHGSNFIQYKSIEFPQSIVEYYNSQYEINDQEIAVNKGIIQDLSLAWVSINRRLFIWKYGPQSLSSFTRLKEKNDYYRGNKDRFGTKKDEKIDKEQVREFELEDTILSIAYGQPKHAIFKQNEVKNVLVVAFPTEIRVKHLKLEGQQLDIQDLSVSINTDHELITNIAFSKKGRIFFGGSTGRVKHVDYFRSQILGFTLSEKFKAQEGMKWQHKLRQHIPLLSQEQQVLGISVDDTRQILYALVEIQQEKSFFSNPFAPSSEAPKSVQRIDLYDLGAFDDDFSFIGSLSHEQFSENLLSSQTNSYRLLPSDRELAIVSVSAVEKNQSNDYFFLIVTQSGIRAYYSLKTKLVTDKKGLPLSVKECKDAREKFAMFERNRPTAEFQLKLVKGMTDFSGQPSTFRNLHFFYDHKDQTTNKGLCLQIDEDVKRSIKSVFLVQDGIVMQKIENSQNRLIFVEANSGFIGRSKENMFANHPIFSELLPSFSVSSEKIGEMNLDFSNREDNSNILSDLTLAQIPDKNLLPSSISGLIQLSSFDQLEATQMIGELAGQQAFTCLNDLSKQCYCPPSHYVVLTSKGILLNYQQRPIDLLYQLIKVLPDYITEPNQSQPHLNLNIPKFNRLGNLGSDQRNNIQEKLSCFDFFEQFILTYGVTETFAMLSQMLCHSHLEYYVIPSNIHISDKQ